jgi:hypothetical protein
MERRLCEEDEETAAAVRWSCEKVRGLVEVGFVMNCVNLGLI